MASTFDAIVIGTGQSGPSLAQRLSKSGRKLAVIERKRFGGTCVNTGCIPTKTLIASARAAWMARRAARYGVMIEGSIRVDMKSVKARKDGIAGESEKGVETMLTGLENCRVIRGHARLTGPASVQVRDETLEAPNIFINVGARAAVPDVPGIDTVPYLTNSSMVDVDYLPEHLLILGGSYVGLEFGQMYRRFGSEVTIFERAKHILSKEDEDIAKSAREILASEGIRTITGASGLSVASKGERIIVHSQAGEETGSHLLVALGRVPNTDDLGLATAGIETDSDGYIKVDDQLRTSVPGIWAMGDCNGKGAFTHTSYNDYEIIAANLLDGGSRRVSDRIKAYNVYIDPPLARVGMSEREVRASGRPALMAIRPMSKVGRAVEKGETQGFLKVLVDAETHRILGACLLGVECDEVVHCILDVMYAKSPYEVIQDAVHIHPTVSELIPTLFGDLKPL